MSSATSRARERVKFEYASQRPDGVVYVESRVRPGEHALSRLSLQDCREGGR